MSHTPGPWSVDSDRPSRQVVVISQFGEIAQVFGGDNMDDETTPNSRLIAAAPDLLEASQRALHHMLLRGWAVQTDHELRKVYEQMKAAIQKAGGLK